MNVAQLIALLETVKDQSAEVWVENRCCWEQPGNELEFLDDGAVLITR